MCLSRALRILDPFLKNILRLLHKLSMQIYSIRWHPIRRVVLAEDKLRGLLVVLLHLCAVVFSLGGELFCGCAVAGVVGLFGAFEAVAAFGGFLAGEVAEAVVFLFGFTGAVVVECCGLQVSSGQGYFVEEVAHVFHPRHVWAYAAFRDRETWLLCGVVW